MKRSLKIINIVLLILFLILLGFLVYLNINSFISTTNRIKEIINIHELKNYFELYNESSTKVFTDAITEITANVEGTINRFKEGIDRPVGQIILSILVNLLNIILNFIIYFCTYGLNGILIAYILLHETMKGTQPKVKTSPLGHFYLTISKLFTKIKETCLKVIKWLLSLLHKNRRMIIITISLILLANGFIYKLLTEIIIFLITYVIRTINLETYIIILQMLQSLFIFMYPKLKYIPTWLLYPILGIIIFKAAISRATYKLRKNHDRLKEFASEDLTQATFINGPPGTGKTLLNVSLTLASEENFIEELEKQMLDYELKYKYLNFGKIRENPDKFPEHIEYINTYNYLKNRGTFIISNYAIFSPYFNEYSKIFNFDYMRVNKPTDIYPLEEYIIISISEFDKEYNSHDDKKAVGEDGAHTFFSTVSHNLKRHTKIFVDYQLKDQVPLRIRGNAENFITIKKREKKYPIILMLYYLLFKIAYKITRYFIKKYESKRKSTSKRSMRKGVSEFKRNDITLPYAILRKLGNTLKNICAWFDSFYYFKLSTLVSHEGEDKGEKRKLYINIRDLSHMNQALYDSTFLSFAYEEKKNEEFKNLDKFTKLAPPKDELSKCNSKFYNQINN